MQQGIFAPCVGDCQASLASVLQSGEGNTPYMWLEAECEAECCSRRNNSLFFFLLPGCVCVCVCQSLRILCGENSRWDPYLRGCNPGERAWVNEPCLNCHPAFVCVSVSRVVVLYPDQEPFSVPLRRTEKGKRAKDQKKV